DLEEARRHAVGEWPLAAVGRRDLCVRVYLPMLADVWLLRSLAGLASEPPDNRLFVEHAARPGAAAGILKRGPQAGLARQPRVGRQVGPRLPRPEFTRTRLHAAIHHQVHRPFQPGAIDLDADAVAFA